MFRLFTFLVGLLLLVLTASGTYQRVTHINTMSCTEISGCYTQMTEMLSQTTLNVHDVVGLIHYISTFDLLLFLAAMLMASFLLKTARLKIVLYTMVLVALVAAQIQLSMHQEFLPSQAVNHLVVYLLSALSLFIAYAVFLKSQAGYIRKSNANSQWLLTGVAALLLLQVAVGAWLAANNAALVCGDFPRCLNSWWPQADYQNAFNLFAPLSFTAKVAINWVHRILAIVVFALMTWIMLSATKSPVKQIRRAGIAISILLLLQIAAGIGIVKMLMPTWLVVLHSVNAVVLMLPLIALRFYRRYTAVDEQDGATQLVDQADLVEREPEVVEPESLYLRLKSQLGRTRTGLGSALAVMTFANRKIDQDLLEEIETSLLMADVGMDVTTEIIARLEESVEKHQLQDVSALSTLLKQQLRELLEPVSQPLVIPEKQGPFVILVVGVNGVGKTTTIGKLAQRLQQQGHSVMLAAGDTFRAAAVEQLQVWGERNHIHVVAQHTGADSASVIFDAVQSAQAKGVDVLIADTAGRLHTKSNLMDELKKIKRITAKVDETAPHEVLLVLDAGTGQNALSQAEHFNKSVELTGIALTKLDGTAKGGMIFALAKQIGVPIRFLGVGEGIHDLQDFNAEQFIDALFGEDAH
ncbi:fused signal recognition particle receptor [Bathymodiolus japonicus methanotrophic gill symbiont]|uniref:signal recognition particle-docking protein FtsY n=1 Tax=Bathymodiolus japonicus methanotrophic gill symbiont TaxID=113269 RepID=UPI001B5C0122|nr:signal recognition particle-docking protein FtsY [Bathymodiolus japonicus methanotrophic gill symbiont]GFO71995.1 fused signal recognition particle receptor [Bathymodiolus japonicus methanotrophic gill symbiont]